MNFNFTAKMAKDQIGFSSGSLSRGIVNGNLSRVKGPNGRYLYNEEQLRKYYGKLHFPVTGVTRKLSDHKNKAVINLLLSIVKLLEEGGVQ